MTQEVIYNLKPPKQADIRFTKKDFSSYLARAALFKTNDVFKDEFFANSPPSIFIGSKLQYPKVNVGILTPPERTEDAWFYDAEPLWPETNLTINDIVKLRSSLINSRFQTDVYTTASRTRFLDIAQEIGMASSSVDVEIHLKKKVKISFDTDKINKPMGPAAQLLKAKITENPKIQTKVDKVVSDTDLKAAEAITYLYKNNFSGNALSQLLSLGVLGLKTNRKLVPTRFSITATDDIVGKHLIRQVKDYPIINDYQLYSGTYFGNYYFIMLFPDIWGYELFEMFLPGSAWNASRNLTASTDYESYEGRKGYAEQCAGGYYSVRLSILEKLAQLKRQASALVIRFETPEYHTGLGVWVTRAAAQKAMNNSSQTFASREELIIAAKNLIKQTMKLDSGSLFQQSKLLNTIKEQKKLTSFFS